MKIDDIKDIKFFCDDLDKEVSIKDYLKELLKTVWRECESFSGKRPFGNSGWQYDIYSELIKHNVIHGVLDEYGGVDELSQEQAEKADEIIMSIIDSF